MKNTDKSTGLAVRELIADKFSDGSDFSLRDFDQLAKKLRITSIQVRSALTQEMKMKSIIFTDRYKPDGWPKQVNHYKLINMDILLRREGFQHAKSAQPLLQVVLDAVIRKRMQKSAASRARYAA